MGDCVGCPGCDRLGRMVVVGVTHGDGFGGGGYGGFDNGMVPAWEWAGMEFKWVSNGNLTSISFRISKKGQGNRLEIKHKNACKQTQIQQEYVKVFNAHIQAPK